MQVGVAAFDLRSASLHLSQYIETSSSYQNTRTLLQFYDPMVIVVPPNKFAPDGMVGVSILVDRFYSSIKKVNFLAWQYKLCTNAICYEIYRCMIWGYVLTCAGRNGSWLLWRHQGSAKLPTCFVSLFWFRHSHIYVFRMPLRQQLKGAVLVKNIAAKEPSALGLDTYYKQYYLCLAAASATIKWYDKFLTLGDLGMK